jgi:hypothetical protein
MGLQPMGKVRDLTRLTGRVSSRSAVRWSRLRAFLGCCLPAALVAAPAVDLPRAQVATAAAEIPPPGGPTGLPRAITFGQPSDAAVGRPVTLNASSVTTTTPSEGTGPLVSFRSDTPDVCTVSGTTATPTAPGFCVITATQGGDDTYAPAPDVARAFRARSGPEPQPSVRAALVPGPPTLVSVQNTGTGATHMERIESSPGARLTTIKEARP